MRRSGNLALSVVLAASLIAGCSSHTTRKVERNGDTEVTETTSESDAGGSGGIVSGTINVIGEVLALPFRLVGGLIRLIF